METYMEHVLSSREALQKENAHLKTKVMDMAGEIRILSEALDEAYNGNKIQDDMMNKVNKQGYDL